MFRSGGTVVPKNGSLFEATLHERAAKVIDANRKSIPICFCLLIRTLAFKNEVWETSQKHSDGRGEVTTRQKVFTRWSNTLRRIPDRRRPAGRRNEVEDD